MLATAETENSQRDFWAMVVVVADTDVSGAVVGGMVEEVEAQVLFFLRSASGLSMKFSDKSRPLIYYLVFIHNKEENIEDYPV
jgi:predicted RNA-binding protein (virulence factor B family)